MAGGELVGAQSLLTRRFQEKTKQVTKTLKENLEKEENIMNILSGKVIKEFRCSSDVIAGDWVQFKEVSNHQREKKREMKLLNTL